MNDGMGNSVQIADSCVTIFSIHLSDSLLEWVELGVEGHGPGAIDDPALDVGPKVHLDNIIRS